jgi:hypothetical protein
MRRRQRRQMMPPPRVAIQPPSPGEWATQVRDTLAAITGAAAVVYIAGGLIFALRLSVAGLPTVSVVGQLPRNVLLSVGLSEGLSPALLGAAVYAALRSLFYKDRRAVTDLKDKTWIKVDDCKRRSLYFGRTGAYAFLIISPALAAAIFSKTAGSNETARWIILGVSALVAILGMLMYPNVRGQIADRFDQNFRSATATVVHSLLFALVLIPGCVAYFGTQLPDEATVCLNRPAMPTQLQGYLVGQTSDNVFIGENSGTERKVKSVPTAQIRQVIVGPHAANMAKICSK